MSVPSGEYVKHTVNRRTAEIFTSGIAIASVLQGYSRQRRAIGFGRQFLNNSYAIIFV